MFAYNPPQLDVGAQYIAQGGENLANGISQAGSGIADAIKQMNALKLQSQQADATADLANQMGLIDSAAVDTVKSLPWQQKVSIAPNLIQMIGQKTTADKIAMMMGASKTKADAAAAKVQTTRYIPGQGYVPSGSISADDSTPSD
jgi:hypothetical protein